MESALLTYIGLLEVDKAAFPSLVDVLGKNRESFSIAKSLTISFSSVKSLG